MRTLPTFEEAEVNAKERVREVMAAAALYGRPMADLLALRQSELDKPPAGETATAAPALSPKRGTTEALELQPQCAQPRRRR